MVSETVIHESTLRCYGDGDPSRLSQRTLLVFVHGYGGDPHATWTREGIGGLAEWVLEGAGLDGDVLSFSFPTSPWKRSNILTAASDLLRLLNHRQIAQKCYGRYVFVTHSTGGLVVKCLLNSELTRSVPEKDVRLKDAELQKRSLIAERTAVIINFAVPHSGVSLFVTSGLFVLGALNLVYSAGIQLWAAVKGGDPSRGFSPMIWQLIFRNPWVMGMEKIHVGLLERAREALLRRPVIIDILADSDPVISRYRRDSDAILRSLGNGGATRVLDGFSSYTIRGTHSEIKLPTSATDLVVSEVSQLLGPLRLSPELIFTDIVFYRSVELDERDRLTVLFNDIDRNSGPSALPFAGSQAEVYQQLVEHVRMKSQADRVLARWFVVAGDAGVGKSVTLRRVARHFAAEYLGTRVHRKAGIVPILIPLQQIGLGDLKLLSLEPSPERPERMSPRSLWEALVEYVCRWVKSDLIPAYLECEGSDASEAASVPNKEWIEEQLKTRPTVLILDAVDEFLMIDRRFVLSDFREFVDIVRERFKGNPELTIILGVRKSQPDLKSMTDAADGAMEILPISDTQAGKMFRGAADLLAQVPEDSKKLLLTPLVLAQLGPRMGNLANARLRTRAGVLRAALEEILRKSFQREAAFSPTPWIDGLALIAWVFFRDDRGNVALGDLMAEIDRLESQWSVTAGSVAEDTTFVRGAAAFLRARKNELLDRTVFVPTSRSSYRFRHREWVDFLVAQYVVQCVRSKRFDEFGSRIFNKDIYVVAGEELDSDDPRVLIGIDDVNAVSATTPPSRRVCALSNLFATMGNSHIQVDPEAMRGVGNLLRSRATDVLPIILGINTFCVRTLRDRSDDQSRKYIRQELAGTDGVLRTILAEGKEGGWNGVLVSQAWCFLHALAHEFPEEINAPAGDWPGFGPAGDGLAFVRPAGGDESEFSRLVYRSVRIAWAAHPHTSHSRAHEAVPMIHYLYAMVCSIAERIAESDVCAMVDRVFVKGSPVSEAIHEYGLVPKLEQIFDVVQSVYRNKSNS